MSRLRWLVALALTLSLVTIETACSREETDKQGAGREVLAERSHESALIQWMDFNEGLVKARSNDKPLFIEFYAEWCFYCKKFRKETLQDRNVAKMLTEKFVAININAEDSKRRLEYQGKSFSQVEFSRYFGITAFPSLAFLEPNGQPITLIPGFVPAAQFLDILDYIQQKCYLTKVSFHEFTRTGGCN